MLESWNENKIEFVEQFKLPFLNKDNRVLGIFEVSTGGVSGTVADPTIIFAAALKANCSSLVICHNHPSGSLKPSRQDQALTQKIREAGSFLDLLLLDHLIVSFEGYYSFADEGCFSPFFYSFKTLKPLILMLLFIINSE